MKWILLFVILSSDRPVTLTQEFDDQTSCQIASQMLTSFAAKYRERQTMSVCVEKGIPEPEIITHGNYSTFK